MPPLRVALVTRHYWPQVGGAERVAINLAEAMHAAGAEVTVVSAQWDSQWPREVDHSGTRVVRLPYPQPKAWGMIRHMWSLTRWLREHRDQLDAVIVSTLRHDAYTAIGALKGTSVPVILRAERIGTEGDVRWQREARFGQRIKQRCEHAEAIIVPSQPAFDELVGAGYSPNRLHFIANGVPISLERNAGRRSEARAILGDANPDMKVTEQTPVAVYIGRLEKRRGVHDLTRSWRRIVDIWPDARLWLIGEGSERSDLYDRLRDHELKYHVTMPGAFDDVTDLLDAADVLVAPAHEAGTAMSLLEAMAVGTPVIATDVVGHRHLVTNNDNGLLVPPKNPTSLAEAIAEVITLREQAERRTERARRRIIEEHSAELMAKRHLDLIAELIAQRK